MCLVEGCNDKHHAKGYCRKHYWQEYNKTDRRKQVLKDSLYRYITSKTGKATRKKNNQARRARLVNSDSLEKVIAEEIYERNFYICGICGLPIDRELKHPNRLSPSLDHILPISKGGKHNKDNMQPAHLICNVVKGTGKHT